MEGSHFEEEAFFRAIADSGARALLIGRRALIALGLPLLTSDYDFWLHLDDIETFDDALTPFALVPTVSAAEARRRGRYVLENDERVDVLLGRSVPRSTANEVSSTRSGSGARPSWLLQVRASRCPAWPTSPRQSGSAPGRRTPRVSG